MATVLQPLSYSQLVAEYGALYMSQFLAAAGGVPARAVRLHAWNGVVAASFHDPLASVEIALRRRADDAFTAEFGPYWWMHPDFRALATSGTLQAIAAALARLSPTAGHDVVVAELAFGTWVAIVRMRFFDRVWRTHRRAAFPNHFGMPFKVVGTTASRVLDLRNAIGHHQPLVRTNLSARYADVLEMLRWMSMPLHMHAARVSWIPQLLLAKP